MALFDWDSNGINDFTDEFIEFNVFMDSINEEENHYVNKHKEKSEFPAFLCVIGSMFLPALICYVFGESSVTMLLYLVLMITGFICTYKHFK